MSKDSDEMRLLVVDDEYLERQAISLIFDQSADPFKVVGEARNGNEAVRLALELEPDIILLDIKMPGMDGLTTAQEIKRVLPACAIIFLTAYDEFDYAQEALRVGAVDYLLKPVRTRELLEVLEKARAVLLQEREKHEERKKLQEQLAEALPWLRVNLSLGLIFGLWEERAAVEQQARLVGLETLPQVAFGVYLESRPQEDATALTRIELLRYQLQRVIEEALQRYPFGLCLPLSERMLIGLWGTKEPEPERRLRQLSEYIIQTASEKLSLRVTVGLGRFCEDLGQLPSSVWGAQTAAHLGMFYLGPERVVHVAELERETGKNHSGNEATEREIIAALGSGDQEKARRLFREFLGAVSGGSGAGLHLIKARLIGALEAFVRSLGLNRNKDWPGETGCIYNDLTRRLAFCHSVEDLEEWMVDLAAAGEKLYNERNGGAVSGAVKRVLAYIHDHYREEISLTDLSRIIFLSPDYFSRIFKEQVGCTFSEYILRLRMEKAKELLSETDLHVGELARQVGYSDPNYFSRVFSRAMGVSPSCYRQMVASRCDR